MGCSLYPLNCIATTNIDNSRINQWSGDFPDFEMVVEPFDLFASNDGVPWVLLAKSNAMQSQW